MGRRGCTYFYILIHLMCMCARVCVWACLQVDKLGTGWEMGTAASSCNVHSGIKLGFAIVVQLALHTEPSSRLMCVFWDTALYSPGWPRTHYVAEDDLKLLLCHTWLIWCWGLVQGFIHPQASTMPTSCLSVLKSFPTIISFVVWGLREPSEAMESHLRGN